MKLEVNIQQKSDPALTLKNYPEGIYLHIGTVSQPEAVFIVINAIQDEGQVPTKIVLYKRINDDMIFFSKNNAYDNYAGLECISNKIKLVAE